MKDLKTALKGFCVVSLSVGALVACGSATKSASRSSADVSGQSRISAEGSAASAKNDYKPLTGRMDGVEFYINKELITAGLDRDSKGDLDFEELHSVFEKNTKAWQPQRGFNLPVVHNKQVDHWIGFFTGAIRTNFERWITRGSHYVPIMEAILKENGVPTDLIYLSMIESGFNTKAYSSAHASGLWQFIGSTGRMYGLESGGSVDERRDIIKSTNAAARHLKDLYVQYKDWYLAFAAYNAGPGTVNRAIRNSGSKDFWRIAAQKRLFRQETKDYVPRILAAATIMKNYKKYGFSSQLFQKPLVFESVSVPDATDMKTLAQCAGITEDEMKYLNPSVVSGTTPFGKPYVVHIPLNSTSDFKKSYAKLAPQRRTFFVSHKVRKNETVASIARKYKTSQKSILSSNKLASGKHLKSGMSLQIPRQGIAKSLGPVKEVTTVAMAQTTILDDESKNTSKNKNIDDVLDDELEAESAKAQVAVADDFEKPTEDAVFAELPQVAAPPATTVRYRVEAARTYKVKRGDSLGVIASRNKTSVANLKKWNDMGKRSGVQTGQILKVSAEQKIKLIEPAVAAPVEVASAQAASVRNEDSPSRATKSSPAATVAGKSAVYKVKAGDTLSHIASSNNVYVRDLMAMNNLEDASRIRPGLVLKLNKGNNSLSTNKAMVGAQKTGSKKSSDKLIIHAVRKGETLWTLSQKYGVSVSQIKQWNNLKQSNLMPNQKLKIFSVNQKSKTQQAA